MPSPTREDIVAAHDSLKEITGYLDHSFSGHTRDLLSDLLENVQEALPPKPKPTMAEVEWNDEEHYLAEAEHPTWGKVIMLGTIRYSGEVTLLTKTGGVIYLPCEPSQSLTPTGRRYTLTEVQVEG